MSASVRRGSSSSISVPHPTTGRRRQKSKSGFATRKEAESALHELIRYIEGGGNPAPDRIKLAAYLDRWLDYQRARGIRPRTLEGYEGYIRRDTSCRSSAGSR